LHIPKALGSVGPQGGIVSTAPECITFLKAFFGGKFFPTDYLPGMRQWRSIFYPLQYGHGMMRFKLPWLMAPFQNAPEFIGHSGSTGSFLFYAPEWDLYIAGTVNQIRAFRKPFQILLQVTKAVR
jgi:D-alanyl-D-alanine carboxypeptidase